MSSTPEGKWEVERGPGSQSSLRSANEMRVLDALLAGGELTQAELARRTALAPSTVSNIVHHLVQSRTLDISDEHGGRRGRMVRLAEDRGLLLGIDVGHQHLSIAVSTLSMEILGEATQRQPLNHQPHRIIAQALDMAQALLREADQPLSALRSVGLVRPSVLPAWAGIDVARLAGQAFGVPAVTENDANAGALAEHSSGAGQGIDNLAYVKLAHGIGAGLILDGRLYRGENGISGELGHTTIDERGIFCRCGNRGCLETVATSPRILAMLADTRPDILSIEDLIRDAQGGDAACIRALADTGRAVGIAMANLCNIINPKAVVIGGELATAGDLLLKPMMEIVRAYGVAGAVQGLSMRTAGLGARSQLIGALHVALSVVNTIQLLR